MDHKFKTLQLCTRSESQVSKQGCYTKHPKTSMPVLRLSSLLAINLYISKLPLSSTHYPCLVRVLLLKPWILVLLIWLSSLFTYLGMCFWAMIENSHNILLLQASLEGESLEVKGEEARGN